MNQTLIVTPGEKDSIGLEVTLKALSKISELNLHQNKSFIFFSDKNTLDSHLKKLNFSNLDIKDCSALSTDLSSGLHWINSSASSFSWFKESVDFCASNNAQAALITGPLRKSSFQESGAVGHTDYLRHKFSEPCFMTFFGDTYNSLLLSDHLSIDKVSGLDFNKLLDQALKVLSKVKKEKK